MEKAELVKMLSEKVRIDHTQAETAVNAVLAELVSPFVLRKPGAEVALLDNSCRNNCKEPSIIQEGGQQNI